MIAAASASARAGGPEPASLCPRGLGRAGAVVVSADGTDALVLNPAGLARREGARVQLGATLVDSDVSYDSLDPDAPTISSRASPTAAPQIGFQLALGSVVVGAAYVELADVVRTLPSPSFDQPANDVARLFPHRYAALSARHARSAVIAGAAFRATDWLGVGASGGFERASLEETRHVWAGFDGRDPLGSAERDLALALSASDPFVPVASAGVLVAPPQVPLELAISGSYAAPAHAEGDARLTSTRTAEFPRPPAEAAAARLRLSPTVTVRTGARYLGDRLTIEVAGELSYFLDSNVPRWRTDGLTVTDESTAQGDLVQLDSLAPQRDHAALRAAVDVEVVTGFVWLTAGYAYRTASAASSRLSVGFADLDTHLVAAGAEGRWGETTLTVGYARALSAAVRVNESESAIPMVNPFAAGSAPAAAGRYDTAADLLGLSVEIAWE